MRYFFLVLILGYGAMIIAHSLMQVQVDSRPGHASATANMLVFYGFVALIYLVLNKYKDWKIIVPYSVIILLFFVRLVASISG